MTSDTGDQKKRRLAYRLVLLFDLVAMFGDFVYEGGRSVSGPFLFTLGASAFMVAFIAGFGEFVGYAIRIGTGYLAGRSRRYWAFVIAGYLMIGAIPLLVFAGSWEAAAFLLILERIGKAIRLPAKDAMLSHVTSVIGRGWGSACRKRSTRSVRSSARSFSCSPLLPGVPTGAVLPSL